MTIADLMGFWRPLDGVSDDADQVYDDGERTFMARYPFNTDGFDVWWTDWPLRNKASAEALWQAKFETMEEAKDAAVRVLVFGETFPFKEDSCPKT